MITLLHLDASARSGRSDQQLHGSHTRRLSSRFVEQWLQQRPADRVVTRDVGLNPPSAVSGAWIHAAFTAVAERASWMNEVLAESDGLIDEILAADILLLGVPMYNFSVPAQFKAWIDNIVRVGRTFGFDRQRQGEPYWPMLKDAGKLAVVLSSRGDHGYAAGQRMASMNHVEPGIRSALGYIGIERLHSIAVEYDEFGDERLHASIAAAEAEVSTLVDSLIAGLRE